MKQTRYWRKMKARGRKWWARRKGSWPRKAKEAADSEKRSLAEERRGRRERCGRERDETAFTRKAEKKRRNDGCPSPTACAMRRKGRA